MEVQGAFRSRFRSGGGSSRSEVRPASGTDEQFTRSMLLSCHSLPQSRASPKLLLTDWLFVANNSQKPGRNEPVLKINCKRANKSWVAVAAISYISTNVILRLRSRN
jgi:hypothetical protein